MDGLVIDDVILPNCLILDGDKLIGYIMEYFKDSIPISDYLTLTRYINCKTIFSITKKVSIILRHIHENNIICQDLSFDNILIDKDRNIKYSDIDGCMYKEYKSPFMSHVLQSLFDYRKDPFHYFSKNTDRISLMLSFYAATYLKELQKLSKKKYHSLSDNMQTLENCREYASKLLSRCRILPDIPYMDELIDDADDYIIDREKQLGLIHRLLR